MSNKSTPRLRSGQKGFTLIELLVVIAIIGLLSTLAVVSLNTAREKARDARREGDIKLLNNAIQLYVQQNDKAPETTGSGTDNVCDSTEDCWASGGDLATALSIYTAPLATDPTNTGDLVYVYVSSAALIADECTTCNSESYQLYTKQLEGDSSTWGFNDSEHEGWIGN